MKKLVFLLFVSMFLSTSLISQTTSLWGITPYGGNGAGCIFRTNSSGENLSIQYALPMTNPGASAKEFKMIKGSNGLFYGLMEKGGVNNEGVLFSYDPVNNIYNNIASFKSGETGRNPYGYLLAASNGKFYGVCQGGGVSDAGTIFEFDTTTNTISKVADFALRNMSHPYGSLIQATNGKIYGVTKFYKFKNGALYEYDILYDSLSVKYIFNSPFINKVGPEGALVQCSNGLLYGSTHYGIYTFNLLNNTINHIHFFYNPVYLAVGSLVKAYNGKIYGIRKDYNNLACIVEIDPATDTVIVKTVIPYTVGYDPSGEMVEFNNATLYGVLRKGKNNKGAVFEYRIDSNKVSAYSAFTGSATGIEPMGALSKSSGKLYGFCNKSNTIAPYGGALFEIDTNTRSITKKLILNYAQMGANILSGLQYDQKGGLWGVCKEGEQQSMGGYFVYDILSHTYSMEYPIVYPRKEVVVSPLLASDGSLYSLNSIGMLYQYDPSTGAYNYHAYSSGKITEAMVEGAAGDFYFMTKGVTPNLPIQIIRFTPSNSALTIIHTFGGINTGRFASGGLLYSPSGYLYGMTEYGGVKDAGVLFKINLQNKAYSKEVDFRDTLGKNPDCGLAEDSNGILYGTTVRGGAYDMGVFFKYDPTNKTYVKIYDFDSLTGIYPRGKLLFASNGNIYGITTQGGANNLGTIFEYNPTTNTLSKKSDFTDSTGRPSKFSYLVEVENNVGIQSLKEEFEFDIFPNPACEILTVKLSHYLMIDKVRVYNAFGKLVYEEKPGSTQQFRLNLHLTSGIYFLKLLSSDGTYSVKKFIVK